MHVKLMLLFFVSVHTMSGMEHKETAEKETQTDLVFAECEKAFEWRRRDSCEELKNSHGNTFWAQKGLYWKFHNSANKLTLLRTQSTPDLRSEFRFDD
jgi:hypothetical protein